MSKDDKNSIVYLAIILLTVLLTYKLPHDSYSIIQYTIPPIRRTNTVINLSGIVPLILFIIGVSGLLKLERFKARNKLIMFILVVSIVTPSMKWALDVSRTNYHSIKDDGINAIDIERSDINYSISDDKMTINIALDLKDYGRSQNEFKIRVYLPEIMSIYTDKQAYDFETTYYTSGYRSVSNIQKTIQIKLNDNYDERKLYGFIWNWEDVKYELYNNREKVKIIRHGL